MGVVNVTPDSFWEASRRPEPDAAVAHGLRLVKQGADLLDVGGESTRPGAQEVPAEEERRRVLSVIEGLRAAGCDVPLSIDTRKAEVARAALRAGADVVNDVSALSDPGMAEAVVEHGAAVVLMHTRGTPADMMSRAVYGDVVAEVERELAGAMARAVARGIPEHSLVLDPGLGFAKDAAQSIRLLAALPRLRRLGRPLLVGPSRKSFIGKVTGAPADERLPGTLAAVTACVLAGVEMLRVHDVAEVRQAALVAAAIRDSSRTAPER
jgi:dihydropteroate synthase